MTSLLRTTRVASALLCLLMVVSACSGGDARPGATAPTPAPAPTVTTGTFEVRLSGASATHAAALLELTAIPDGSSVTASSGVVIHSRARSGQGLRIYVAGDLTGSVLLRLTTPTSAGVTPRGSVLELSTASGTLVDGALPGVTVTAVAR